MKINNEVHENSNLSNKSSTSIKGKRDARIFVDIENNIMTIKFKHTLFVPNLRTNSVSVVKIANQTMKWLLINL